MDAYDIFKKLCVGTKFDVKRYHTDAVRFKISKATTSGVDDTQAAAHALKTDDEVQSSKKRNKKKRENSESSSAHRLEVAQNDVYDDDDVQLLSSLNSQEPKVKKAKVEKSLQKLVDIKREQINHYRKQNRIHVWGEDVPDPLETFGQLATDFAIHENILSNIMRLGYATPTPIQMQAVPLMLHRREILACAPTGSGKTAAFLLPVLHHLKKPRRKGFRAVVVEPTRELAKQVYRECCRLAEGRNFGIHIIEKAGNASEKYGPNSSQKFDILITTPNRLIYLLQQEPPGISLKNVEWLIIDESDKLFEAGVQGFRDQLAVIYKACDSSKVRHAMFSATFAPDVEEWCKLNLDNPVTVTIGARNSAVDTVSQELIFVGSESGKLIAFRNLVKKGLTPPVLVFVQSKDRAKDLFNELIYDGINVEVIHADRTQLQRDNVVKSFRAGKIWVLICTELMGRGIDFKGVNLVVNYDFPPSAVSYIHRIGRTGRAGRPGRALTFFTEEDSVNLRSIAQVMKDAGCPVPDYMLNLRKPTKQIKRQLLKKAPHRDTISTTPLYDIEKAQRKKRRRNHKAVNANSDSAA